MVVEGRVFVLGREDKEAEGREGAVTRLRRTRGRGSRVLDWVVA